MSSEDGSEPIGFDEGAEAGSALKALETENRRLRVENDRMRKFIEGEAKVAEARVLSSFYPVHIEAALAHRRKILTALDGENPGRSDVSSDERKEIR